MVNIYDDIAEEFTYLASLPEVGMKNIHQAVEHLTEKHGNEQLIKQIFYAVISIELTK